MAGKYNFTIEQGATFTRVMTWRNDAGEPIDLRDYAANLKAKLSVEHTAPVIHLSSLPDPGGITLGGDAGTITLNMTAAQTAELEFETAVYDLELSKDGNVTRLLEGQITLSREITK